MKPIVLIAILLLVIGALALGYQGFTYVTQEKIVDVGPVQVKAEKENYVPLPPIVGGIAVVSGLVLLAVASRNSG